MTKPAETAKFAASTGRSWAQWRAFLDEIGARDLPHKEIARRIVATGDASGWWAQGIAVAYEQHIGRRAPGQRGDGRFEVSVSRTLPGTLDDAMARWEDRVAGDTDFDGVALLEHPTRSDTPKWRYWRCSLADGTRVAATVGAKTTDAATLTIAHTKLADAQAVSRWRTYWRSRLDVF